jgi:hypothetical protein
MQSHEIGAESLIRKTVFALALCVLPSAAGAATIDFTGLGKAEVVSLGGVRVVNAWAGELNWVWLSGQPEGSANPFYTYCVDLLNNETDHQGVAVSTSDEMTGSTPNVGQKAAWLFNTYADTIHANYSSASQAMAAGLQLAIWEVLYDTTYEIDGTKADKGNFYATGVYTSAAAISYGNQYLQDLLSAGTSYLSADARWLDSDNATYGLDGGPGQDQITRSVPEPGTLVLLAAGLFGIAGARRKKKADLGSRLA